MIKGYIMIEKREYVLEFLLVCKTKLKVILDREEVEHYRLSDFTSSESRELRQRLSEILSEAEARVGFHAEGERLLVSYYPTRLAGAELFVTVVRASDKDHGDAYIYYIFDTLAELCRVCRAVLPARPASRVYLLPGGEYCLALSYPDGEPDVASEFAEPTSGHHISSILSRSRILASDDAATLFAGL